MTRAVLTYDDFAPLPNDGKRYELHEGELSVSPSSISIDRRRKLALYAAHDVPWYWIVDPEARTIEVYRLDAGAYRLDATLEGTERRALQPFPALSLDPADVWR